jgi:SAM-dependent methyltransferase
MRSFYFVPVIIESCNMETLLQDDYQGTAQYYDHVGLYVSRNDVQFWVDEAVQSGGPVLELGCGTGRVLIPTARAGVEITGLDMSASMLDTCRTKLHSESREAAERVKLVQDDMRSFNVGSDFALVTIPFRPFQHLFEVEDQLACLSSARRALRAGGKLVFDLFNPSIPKLNEPIGEVVFTEEPFAMSDGRTVIRKHRFVDRDLFRQVNTIELIHAVSWPDGRQEEDVWRFEMRYFFRYEIEHLVERAGFAVENIFAGYDRSLYGSTYPGELIVSAIKR